MEGVPAAHGGAAMAARRLSSLATTFIAALALAALSTQLLAQESGAGASGAAGASDATAAPDVPNAPFNFVGEVTGGNVYVRSGPSDSYYPTAKLSKGTRITVRGTKFNYLKIEPPQGSFSYVGKAYVERRGDGGVGRVTTAANVRTGSELNPMKTTVQTKLDAGTDVKIVGEQEEYYKIEPPPGAYLYVQKDFVAPVERIHTEGDAVATNAQPQQGQPRTAEHTAPAPDSTGATGAIAEAATRGQGEPSAADAPTTGQSIANGSPTAPPSASQPAAGTATADARFEKIEGDFEAANQRPVIDQPVEE